MKVAFLGLGNMGSGIAKNILASDLELVVWNRTASKAESLIEQGATAASTVSEAVAGADVVVSSLMDDASILENAVGEDGILAGMKEGATHVCVTTISPSLADRLLALHNDANTHYVSCPVLGRPDAAADGSLIALVAGSQAGIEASGSVIETFTSMVVPLGAQPSHAATLKLCLNYTVISSIELMGEIYTVCEKAGLNLEEVEGFFKVIYGFPVLHMYAEKLRKREFTDGGFRMTGGLKDVRLMLDSAADLGASFDIGKIIENKMLEGLESGYEDLDWSAIYEVSRARAKLDHVEEPA